MIRSFVVVAGLLFSLALSSAPATAEEDGSTLTRRAHHFAAKWFDHVAEGDWAWVRRSTNTTNLPMQRVKKLEGVEIEVDSCSRRSDFGGEPKKPTLRYCFAGGAEWKIVQRDNGWLRMKDVTWYR